MYLQLGIAGLRSLENYNVESKVSKPEIVCEQADRRCRNGVKPTAG